MLKTRNADEAIVVRWRSSANASRAPAALTVTVKSANALLNSEFVAERLSQPYGCTAEPRFGMRLDWIETPTREQRP